MSLNIIVTFHTFSWRRRRFTFFNNFSFPSYSFSSHFFSYFFPCYCSFIPVFFSFPYNKCIITEERILQESCITTTDTVIRKNIPFNDTFLSIFSLFSPSPSLDSFISLKKNTITFSIKYVGIFILIKTCIAIRRITTS